MENRLTILYEDNHLIAVYKEGGLLVQGDRTGDPTLLAYAKEYLKQKYAKPGNVFVGLVHRLDRPVSGVVLFARTSKAASRVARIFKERQVEKTYAAVVEGMPESAEGTLEDLIVREGKRSRMVQPRRGEDGVPARLHFRAVAHIGGVTLLEVHPETGRHHQIRLQLSHMGHPIVGDVLYGAAGALPTRTIGLHAWKLSLPHPVKDETVVISAPPPESAPWIGFREYFRE
jgi:23S rRNA pseudouridine1911/1915/1917 synthase